MPRTNHDTSAVSKLAFDRNEVLLTAHVKNGFSAVRLYVSGLRSMLKFVERALNGKVLARHEQAGISPHGRIA